MTTEQELASSKHARSRRLAELADMRGELAAVIINIQAQLADRDRHDAGGGRLTAQEYWQWRRSATYKLAGLQREMQELKAETRRVSMIEGNTADMQCPSCGHRWEIHT